MGPLVYLVYIAFTIFWLWMLIEALTKETSEKLLWALVVILLGPLGALIYFFVRHPHNR